jgi:hypothetical protein
MVTVGNNARLFIDNRRPTEQEEMAIGERYAMRGIVLIPGAENTATWVSLTALTQRGHSDAAIQPTLKGVLLMQMHRE